ncbi:MAG: Fe-S-containing hydro-lyase [Acetobacteraceae bacterium]|nr:Fe-S-containing hydro-lyase [Acetobacteraceae bacterium]
MVELKTPLDDRAVAALSAGDRVLITGHLYTARDAAHERLVKALEAGQRLPFDLAGQIIYYVGPSPAKPGRVIGSAGPTTSGRMDPYTPALLERGLKGMIGKGSRSAAVREALKKYNAVYFAAVGGAAALITKCIVGCELVAYEDLGPEAIRRLRVERFPVVVINDARGGDLYEEGLRQYSQAGPA